MRGDLGTRGFATILGLAVLFLASGADGRRSRTAVSRGYFQAQTLFERVWKVETPNETSGDGLGPLFNDVSCVACHNQKGVGGAGDNRFNVTILALVPGASVPKSCTSVYKGELAEFHPGFLTSQSLVLHRQASTPEAQERLDKIRGLLFVQTRDQVFAIEHTQRSTPALFGAGRIDGIPEKALMEAEARTFPEFPQVKGRVSRLPDGRIGRFGWKGQTARLEDFILAACANELGLEVRGHHQVMLTSPKDYNPAAIKDDLGEQDLDRLTWFVSNLPSPTVRPFGGSVEGEILFHRIGCGTCHAKDLGGVRGLFSDLLLHDLGDRFISFGGGYGMPSRPASIVDSKPAGATPASKPSGQAGPTEWRTPPLWGVADSPPYLHDGRASTLNEAILLHGGEAEVIAKRYQSLAPFERQAILAFLHSLVAPKLPGRLGNLTIRQTRAR